MCNKSIHTAEFCQPNSFLPFPVSSSLGHGDSRLVNNRNFAQKNKPNSENFDIQAHRITKYFEQRDIQKLLISCEAYSRICTCGHYAIPSEYYKNGKKIITGFEGQGEVHKYQQKDEKTGEISTSHGFYGLERCKNAFFCPQCGSKILAHRRKEIQIASNALIKANFKPLFVTFTAPHTFNDKKSYKESFESFREGMRKFKQGSSRFNKDGILKHYGFRKIQNEMGWKFQINSTELTVDDYERKTPKTGNHLHQHILVFCEREEPFTENEAKELKKVFTKRWYESLVKSGHIEASEKTYKKMMKWAVDVSLPSVKNQGKLEDDDLIKGLVEYVTKGFSFELSSNGTKNGKKEGRLDLYHYLLKLARDKNLENLKTEKWRVREIYKALKGLTKIRFSQGLLAFAGLKEISEEEICYGNKAEEIYAFNTESEIWLKIARGGRKGHVLKGFDNENNGEKIFDLVGRGYDPCTGEEINDTSNTS